MIAAPLYDDLEGIPDGGQAYWRTASDGLRIRTAVWRSGGDKTVLVLPGRTEFIEKYGGVILRLLRRNYSVAIIDWRGQGLSERHATKRDLGWVKDFSEYQLDVAELLENVIDPVVEHDVVEQALHPVVHAFAPAELGQARGFDTKDGIGRLLGGDRCLRRGKKQHGTEQGGEYFAGPFHNNLH